MGDWTRDIILTALIPNAASLVRSVVIGGIRFRLGLLSELILSKEERI
jgi:hypothetical protein